VPVRQVRGEGVPRCCLPPALCPAACRTWAPVVPLGPLLPLLLYSRPGSTLFRDDLVILLLTLPRAQWVPREVSLSQTCACTVWFGPPAGKAFSLLPLQEEKDCSKIPVLKTVPLEINQPKPRSSFKRGFWFPTNS